MGPFVRPRGADDTGPEQKKKRRLGRRDTDEQVREAIKRQLPGVSQTALTQHIVDGKSLLDRIRDDKRKAKKEGRNLGPLYWRGIKEMYGIESSISSLQVNDPTEPIDDELMRALEMCRNPNAGKRSKTLLQSWFGSVRAINQRCMVAVVKQCFGMKPTSKSAQGLLMCFMKCCVRLGLLEKYSQDRAMQHLRNHVFHGGVT